MNRHPARTPHAANDLTPFEESLVAALNDVANTPDAPQFDAVIIKGRVRRRRSTVTGLVLGAALVAGGTATALALTNMAAGSGPTGAATVDPAATKPPNPSASPADTPWQDPAAALRSQGSKVWADTGRRTGSGRFPLPAQPHAGTVWTSIECQGIGKVTVVVGTTRFTEPCSTGASGTLNADELPFSTPATHLEVTGDAGVTWAVAVGWSRTAPSTDPDQ